MRKKQNGIAGLFFLIDVLAHRRREGVLRGGFGFGRRGRHGYILQVVNRNVSHGRSGSNRQRGGLHQRAKIKMMANIDGESPPIHLRRLKWPVLFHWNTFGANIPAFSGARYEIWGTTFGR
jgi:hypothetical protein